MSRPMQGPGGVVYSSGLGVRPRPATTKFSTSGVFRAIVLETYVIGDPDAGVPSSEGASKRIDKTRVEADVVIARTGHILLKVPVLPQRNGINDDAPWVPRKTTRTITGNEPLNMLASLSYRGVASPSGVTPLDDVDGDIVLVEFLEEDRHFPVIRGSYPHPRTRRAIVEGSGWEEGNAGSERGTPQSQESYLRYAGTEARVNDAGDVLLDTVGATSDKVDEDPATGAGQVRLRLKDSERLTVEMDGIDVLEVWKDGSQVKIDLGEGATERLVMGDAFRSFLNGFLSSEWAKHQHLPGTFVGASEVTGQSGPVAPVALPPDGSLPNFLGIQMGEDVLSDLSRTKKN